MRDLVIAFSAANLTFLAVWRRLVLASDGERFWMRVPTREDALAAILNVLLLAAVLFALLWMARRLPPGALRTVLLALPALALIIPLSTIFGGNGPVRTFGHYGVWLVYALTLAIAVFVLVRWHRQVHALLLILAPFVLFTVGQAAWMAARPPVVAPVSYNAGPVPENSRGGRRVVMIVFDEMEQRLAFDQRPAGLELPNLDRLRAESFSAERALPPGDGTHVSVPSLLTGQKIVAARPESAAELWVRAFGGESPGLLAPRDTLFGSAAAQGLRTAVVGWHLPYCRVFGELLAYCFDQPRRDPHPRDSSVGTAMLKQAQSLFYLLERNEHIVEYQTLLEHAKKAAADPSYDFVFLHMPVPHGPPIYDRHSQQLTINNFRRDWYLDNLALTDRALGELRRGMEAAGVWERTAIVLTSDHVWLLADKYVGSRAGHVPLLVRVAGAQEGERYEKEVTAISAHAIVLGLLQGEIRSLEDVPRFTRP